MGRIGWILSDPLGDASSVTLEINPSSADAPDGITKTMTYQVAAAPSGQALVFEGRPQVRVLSISGTLLTEDQYTTMQTWANKTQPITMTDDLGRVNTVIITDFKPTRDKTSAQFPWLHKYTASVAVLA